MRKNSIKKTLIVKIGLVILGVNITVGICFKFFTSHQLEREFAERIELEMTHLTNSFTHNLWILDLKAMENIAAFAIRSQQIQGIKLLDQNQKVIVKKGVFNDDNAVSKKEQLIYNHKPIGHLEIHFTNAEWLKHYQTVQLAGGATSLLIMIILMVFLYIILTQHIVTPLYNLAKDMDSIAKGCFLPSRITSHKVEIQNIINVFNQMASSLAYRENEQKKAELKLVKSQERFHSLFFGSKDSIFTVNLDGTFIDCNPAMQALLGVSSEEVKTLNVFDLIEIDPGESPLQYQIQTDGSISDFRIKLRTRTKGIRNCLISGTLWTNEDGNMLGHHHILRDITDQEQMQIQLRQAQKMEAIGTLAGGIAHDFNNILMAIFGFSHLAMTAKGNQQALQQSLDGILQAAHRAKDLIKQILTFSRQGRQEKLAISLTPISKEVIKLLRQAVPSTIEIKTNINTQSAIIADPTQMHQVLMNLGTNAYQAMRRQGGILQISVTDVTFNTPEDKGDAIIPPGPYVSIVVSDDGPGMDTATKEKIFEPYFTTKTHEEGTGLGLAVVHGIIVDHRGYIHVDSILGQGTTFSVYLPSTESQAPQLNTDLFKPSDLQGNERILFVDDESELAKIAQKVFVQNGYTIQTFLDPTKALEQFTQTPDAYDIVITDMTMPNLTGMELTDRILQLRPDTPVILCTGYSELVSCTEAKERGVCEFIDKPYPMSALLATIRKIFSTSKDNEASQENTCNR